MDTHKPSEDLLSWIKSEARNVINAEIAEFSNMGSGLICKKALKKNDVVLSIHKNFFLSLETCFNDKFMKEKVYPKAKDLNSHQKFILFLWKQISIGKDSKWSHYFQSLPRTLTNLVLWPQDCVQALQRQDLIHYALEKQKKVELEFNALSSFIESQGLSKEIKPMGLEDYKWLYSIIESRAVSHVTKYDINSQIGALIPVYDYANHDFLYEETESLEEKVKDLSIEDKGTKGKRKLINPQEYFYYDSVKGFYVLKAHKDYQEGEQVFIMYSGKPNLHFLDYYGFVPRNNPNNCVNCNILLKEEERPKYFPSAFKEEFAKKLKICHYLLPQIAYKIQPPGYMEGIDMRKKAIMTLADTLQVEVEEEDCDLSWQSKTFVKIFSLPGAVCDKFLRKEDHSKHDHDDHEHEEDDEHIHEMDEAEEEDKELVQDLISEEYFIDETHRKNYMEMMYKLSQKIKGDLYPNVNKEALSADDVNNKKIVSEFVQKEVHILEGLIKRYVI